MADVQQNLFLFLVVVFAIFCQICGTGIPALVWSPSRSFVDLPDVYAGHTVRHQDFESKYLDPITANGKELIVVFIQNKLGLEDFAHHADIYSVDGRGGAFHHVKSLLDDNFSLQLPAVDFPAKSIVRLLEKFGGKLAELEAPYDVTQLDLTDKRVLLVRLPDIQAANEKDSFAHNDELIEKVLSGLNRREYVAIYTAQSHEQDSTLKFHGRHLLAAQPNETLIYVNETCFLLYTRGITLRTRNASHDIVGVMPLADPDYQEDVVCGNETAKLTLDFKPAQANGSDVKNVKIELNFATLAGSDWYISEASLTYEGKLPGDNLTDPSRTVDLNLGQSYLNTSAIWAPRGMSYHCTTPTPFEEVGQINTTTSDVTLFVVFDKLQLQPFDVSKKSARFGAVYDCVPFFSGMIWTGLLSTALLLFILFMGLSMISDIKVMKNFDDPKGKPLIVQTDE